MQKIAIVIATYNGAATLDALLDSLANQSETVDQIIVIDGASSDGTVEILRRREAMISHWRSERDTGVYDAWNKGLSEVRCEWVSFIGCDDVLADTDTIAQWKRFLSDQPGDVGIAYGRVAMVGANGQINGHLGAPWTRSSPREFQRRMMIPFTGSMIRRPLFDRFGEFDASFRISGDYDWVLRAVDHTKIVFNDRTVALMGDGGLSGASGSQVRAINELSRIFSARGIRRPIIWKWTLLKAKAKDALLRRLGPDLQRWAVDLYRACTGRKMRGSAR
jgi:glycosyltransferase involved in cell wall biosynthesis